jgi:hypothetical protein
MIIDDGGARKRRLIHGRCGLIFGRDEVGKQVWRGHFHSCLACDCAALHD